MCWAAWQGIEPYGDGLLTITPSQAIEEKQVRRRLTPDSQEGLSATSPRAYQVDLYRWNISKTESVTVYPTDGS